MATLSELYAIHGESAQYVCDEHTTSVLYWNVTEEEFWVKSFTNHKEPWEPFFFNARKAISSLTVFLRSNSVRVYVPEVEKEPESDRLTTIESWLKTIAQKQNVHDAQMQDLHERFEDGYNALKKQQAVLLTDKKQQAVLLTELTAYAHDLTIRLGTLERAAVKPHTHGKAKPKRTFKSVPTVGVYDGAIKKRTKK